MLYGRGPLHVSGHWSDSPYNWFLILFMKTRFSLSFFGLLMFSEWYAVISVIVNVKLGYVKKRMYIVHM
jgi:hypothetical protein